jgi:hypothetical protein
MSIENMLPPDINESDIPEEITLSLDFFENQQQFNFKRGNVTAVVGSGYTTTGDKQKLWATVYRLNNFNALPSNIIDAWELMKWLRDYYSKHGYDFAYASADNTRVKELLYKTQIKEREIGTLKG